MSRERTWILLDQHIVVNFPIQSMIHRSLRNAFLCLEAISHGSIKKLVAVFSIHVLLLDGMHTTLRSILAKQEPETGLCVFSKEVEFMRWFPIAFFANVA